MLSHRWTRTRRAVALAASFCLLGSSSANAAGTRREAENHYFAALFLMRCSSHFEARKQLNRAISIDPQRASYFYLRGQTWMNNQDYEQDYRHALADFSRALQLQPNSFSSLFGRAQAKSNIAMQIGMQRDNSRPVFTPMARAAYRDFTRVLALNPRFKPAYEQRAWLNLTRRGRMEDYTHVLWLDPKDAEMWGLRAEDFAERGQLRLAVRDLTCALKFPRDNGGKRGYLARRAEWFYKMGKLSAALRDTEDALRVEYDQPDNGDSRLMRARISFRLGRVQSAWSDLEILRRRHIESSDYFRLRARIYRKRQNFRAARQESYKALHWGEQFG